jgi:hypothetical protein
VAVKSITDNFSCNAPLWILLSKSLSVDDSCTAPPRGIQPRSEVLLCGATTPNNDDFFVPPVVVVATTTIMGDAMAITITANNFIMLLPDVCPAAVFHVESSTQASRPHPSGAPFFWVPNPPHRLDGIAN